MRPQTGQRDGRAENRAPRSRRAAAPQSRDWAGLQTRSRRGTRARPGPLPAAAARATGLQSELRSSPYVVAVAWATIWRYVVVGGVTLAMFAGVRPPLLAAAAIGFAGLILGLWRRRWWAAGLWRAAMLGWAIGASSGSELFPYLIAGSLAVVTLEPWLVARGRRAQVTTSARSAALPVAAPAAPGVAAPELPEPVWPRSRRRG